MDVQLRARPRAPWQVWGPDLDSAPPLCDPARADLVTGVRTAARRVVRTAPLTIALIVLVWVYGLATRSLPGGPEPRLLERIGTGVGALADGRWWTPLSAALWWGSLGAALLTTVLVMLAGTLAEQRSGGPRTAALLIGIQVVATLVTLGAIAAAASSAADGRRAGRATHRRRGTGRDRTVLAVSSRDREWRRRLRLVLLAAAVMLVFYSGHSPTVAARRRVARAHRRSLPRRAPGAHHRPGVADRDPGARRPCGRRLRRRAGRCGIHARSDRAAVGAEVRGALPTTGRRHRATDLHRSRSEGMRDVAGPAPAVRNRACPRVGGPGAAAAHPGRRSTPGPARRLRAGSRDPFPAALGFCSPSSSRPPDEPLSCTCAPGAHTPVPGPPPCCSRRPCPRLWLPRTRFTVRHRPNVPPPAPVTVVVWSASTPPTSGRPAVADRSTATAATQILADLPTRFLPLALGEVEPDFLPRLAAIVLFEWTRSCSGDVAVWLPRSSDPASTHRRAIRPATGAPGGPNLSCLTTCPATPTGSPPAPTNVIDTASTWQRRGVAYRVVG